jgi:hypothetical protein
MPLRDDTLPAITRLPRRQAEPLTDMIATIAPIVAAMREANKTVWRAWIELHCQRAIIA